LPYAFDQDTSTRECLDPTGLSRAIRPISAPPYDPANALSPFAGGRGRQIYLARRRIAERFPCKGKHQSTNRHIHMLSHPSLRRRIVLPFIVLVVFVGAVGIAVVSGQVGGAADGTVDNSLVRSSLRTNDRLAGIENDRLQQLRAAADTMGIDRAV